MACDCFEKAKNKVRQTLDDPNATIRSVYTIVERKVMCLPSIEVIYHKKKRDGTREKKESSIDLTYGYCPFCGKKIIEDNNEVTNNENDTKY